MTKIKYATLSFGGLEYKLAVASEGTDNFHLWAEDSGAWNNVQDCLLSLLSPGDTLLDIGANIGTVSIPLAAKGVRVIAYEALRNNVRFLEAAVRANKFEDRVKIRSVAAWECASRLVFTGNSAWGRVVPGQGTHEAVAIDADLPPNTKVTAIKLDVEGAELHVGLLKSQHPHIVFESNPLELGRLGSSVPLLFNLMKQYGYRIYRIYARRRFLRPGRFPQETDVCDFLATRIGAWHLRWTTRSRVGSLRHAQSIERILGWADESLTCHLHLLAVADRLPSQVTGDPRVAALLGRLSDRYRNHPLIDIIRRGQFADTAPSRPIESESHSAENLE